MLFRSCLLLLGLVLFAPASARAQLGEDLYLYGFFQGQYRYSSEPGSNPDKVSSFSLQQLNAFLLKDFNASFSAFVNTELTNTFSTARGWGALSLEEAWVRYNHNAKLNVKAGLLTPTFGNLNEVKNRTPLLPYIWRPAAYETSFNGILDTEGFAPARANVQVYGAFPLGDLRLDYAGYVGNNSEGFAATEVRGTVTPGTDMTTSKLVGGRIGLRWGGLRLGVSAAADKRLARYDFTTLLGQPVEVLAQLGLPAEAEIGEVPRTRFNADASFYRGRLFGEAELIRVLHDLSDEQQQSLSTLRQATNGVIVGELDQLFYYGMLGYNLTDRVFAYGSYSYIEDKGISAAQAAGVDFYSVGGGYRPVDGVVAKLQYIRTAVRENPLTSYSGDHFFAGVSVSF